MFGVNLKLRYPFIGAVAGSGIGAAYISFFKVKAIALGTTGLPGFISINPTHWLVTLLNRNANCICCFSCRHFSTFSKKTNKTAVES